MKFFNRVLTVAAVAITSSIAAQAQLPFTESFKNSTASNMVFGGDPGASLTAGKTVAYPGGTITDGAADGYLRLTAANGNERGYTYNKNSFPAAYGLKLSFEYFTYGGNGADGICFFLFDASTPTFSIGGFGGSLGYCMRNAETGLSGAYLGIGLDEYGNFCNYGEGRNTPSTNGAQLTNTVTLRGKGDGTANYWYNSVANGVPNYNYITHVQTTSLSPAFTIGGASGRVTSATDPNYRKVEIDLAPRTVTVGGTTGIAYTISVRILTGSANGLVSHNVITGVNYDQLAPANLKFGFAASTGGSNNYHEIRNFDIRAYNTAPYNPSAASRSQSVCSGNTSTFLLRDAVTPANMPLALDSNSIRFINPTNNLDTVTSYTFPGVGTLSVVPDSKGYVTFDADPSFTSGTAAIKFVMKDNYGKGSNAATLTLNAGTGISGNTISIASGSSKITGSTPAYSGTVSYLWQESITSGTSGFYAAPGTNNAKDYVVASSTASKRWYRRMASSGTCSSASTAQPFTATATPLPVQLISFNAQAQEAKVAVNWTTGVEDAIDGYTIERSADGRDFESIGDRNAYNTAGGTHHYDFTDSNPLNGRSYYRLAIHDSREGTSYSAVVPVVFGNGVAAPSLLIFPEPAASILQVSVSAAGNATIFSAQGAVVSRTAITEGTASMDVSGLPAGIYYLTFESNGNKIVRKFTKL